MKQIFDPATTPKSGTFYKDLKSTQYTRYYAYDKNGNVINDKNGQPLEYSTFLRFSADDPLGRASVKPAPTPGYKIEYTGTDGMHHSTTDEGFVQLLNQESNKTQKEFAPTQAYGAEYQAQQSPTQAPTTNNLDPYNTGKVYNPNVNPNEPHYVYGQNGSLVWYEPQKGGATPSSGTTGAPSTGGTNNAVSTSLNFKSGLTQSQKDSITNMLSNRVNAPLNETDAKNLAFALGQSDYQQYVGKTSSQLGLYGKEAEVQVSAQGSELMELPADIINSPAWQSLSADQQSLIKLYYSASNASSEEQKQKFDLALQEAIKVADPWMKEQVSIVKDEIDRSLGSLEGDFQSKFTSTQNRIKQLQEDLTFNRDYLSLEQQAELSQQLRKYKGDLFNLQQGAAESGLTFSSPRTQAEQQLKEEQQGLVESTQRKYNKSQRELQLGTERSTKELEQNISDLERSRQENLTELQRRGETTLGSAGAPTVSGITPLGGITGTLPEKKAGYITDWTGTLLNNPLNI